jgi:hypothetical protein
MRSRLPMRVCAAADSSADDTSRPVRSNTACSRLPSTAPIGSPSVQASNAALVSDGMDRPIATPLHNGTVLENDGDRKKHIRKADKRRSDQKPQFPSRQYQNLPNQADRGLCRLRLPFGRFGWGLVGNFRNGSILDRRESFDRVVLMKLVVFGRAFWGHFPKAVARDYPSRSAQDHSATNQEGLFVISESSTITI